MLDDLSSVYEKVACYNHSFVGRSMFFGWLHVVVQRMLMALLQAFNWAFFYSLLLFLGCFVETAMQQHMHAFSEDLDRIILL